MPNPPGSTPPPSEYQPLIIGPDGNAYWSTPIVYEPAAWPVFVTGQGDPVSDFIADLINNMIVTSPLYTPPNPWVRKPPESSFAFESNPSPAAGAPSATDSSVTAGGDSAASSTADVAPADAAPTPSLDGIRDAYPDFDDMIDATRNEFIRRASEYAEKRAKEAKERYRKDKEKSDAAAAGEHLVGDCWCGQTHPDHVRFEGKCWCGKEGIHAVGSPR